MFRTALKLTHFVFFISSVVEFQIDVELMEKNHKAGTISLSGTRISFLISCFGNRSQTQKQFGKRLVELSRSVQFNKQKWNLGELFVPRNPEPIT